jgi:hypothetical protein
MYGIGDEVLVYRVADLEWMGKELALFLSVHGKIKKTMICCGV